MSKKSDEAKIEKEFVDSMSKGIDVDKDGIDDSVDTDIVAEVPIISCLKCNDTGAVAKRTHVEDNGVTVNVIDEYMNCSCGISNLEREEAKKVKFS